MRAGLSTIQQTLTPDAASVLNHSISEAARRNHGQTTPLHVAATLLASPTGYLRQACIKSHPNSSHPLQCRALELCFSVALERLPTAQNMSPGVDPPISNALMAALKRAQAHQRRGCPEQQQQPLLAVKVELEQLIISILDDPSVSRVMREASFSSPAVKSTIEQSLNSSNHAPSTNSAPIGLGFRPTNRNLYLNPRLQQGNTAVQSGGQRGDEVKKVIDILLRTKKRNPVLVGESEPELLTSEILRKVKNNELGDGALKNVQVIHLGKELDKKTQTVEKIKELSGLIEKKMGNSDCNGVVLDLGDLKWLVEQQVSFPAAGGVQPVSELGRAAVSEMGKLVGKFNDGGGKVWLIGTATCETYLRCQVYHPSMENDWDLQAVPIAARAPLPGLFPRLGTNGILSNSVDSLSPLKNFPNTATTQPSHVSEILDRKTSCCPQCMQSYENDLAQFTTNEMKQSSSDKAAATARSQLPQWLQNVKPKDGDVDRTDTKDRELVLKEKSQELLKKWNESCFKLHPTFHHSSLRTERIALSMSTVFNPNQLSRQPFQPKLQLNRNLGTTLKLNSNLITGQPIEQNVTPPGSPVRTELVLGRTKVTESTQNDHVKDFLGCISSEPQKKIDNASIEKLGSSLEVDLFKRLIKGLTEKVWWQHDAASALAGTVTQCRLGLTGKTRGLGSKGDIWLLFTGPDRVGKRKMASAMAELVCGSNPITINLGSRRDDEESDFSFRGRTALDRIAEAVKRNPFSVIMLEDIDEADIILRGNLKRAMDRGRFTDSHGREVSLGNCIFVLTANRSTDNLKIFPVHEKKLGDLVTGGWQLRLALCEKTAKRKPSWLTDEENRSTKPRKEPGSGLSFDLNEAADTDHEDIGSRNSSDLTVDHEDEHGLSNRILSNPTWSVPREWLGSIDDTIVFKPVDFNRIRRNVANSITEKASTVIGHGFSVEVHDEALEKIVGGIWLGRTSLEEWTEKVLTPSLRQLKSRLPKTSEENMFVRLEPDIGSDNRNVADLLPSSIKLMV